MSEKNLIRDRRVELDLTMKELADLVGVSEATISRWESGDIANMKRDRINNLAKALHISPLALLGWKEEPSELDWAVWNVYPGYNPAEGTISEFLSRNGLSLDDSATINPSSPPLPSNIIPMPAMRRIPLVGTIACGTPILAQENIDGEVDVPDHVRADFALRCTGDSMINARIFDGDIVYIRQQPTVENGEIAAVLIGDEATLKRFRRTEDRVILEPANPLFDPLVYRGEDMDNVHILGLAVAFTSTVR